MKKVIFAVILGSIAISGCMEKKIYRPSLSFNETELKSAMQEGTSSLSGQAFAKTKGGDVKYAAGEEVTLIPLTPYVQETIELRKEAGSYNIVETDPRLEGFKKKTIANGEGRFKFDNLSSGKYLVKTQVTWQVPAEFMGESYMSNQGGEVSQEVELKDGEASEIILVP